MRVHDWLLISSSDIYVQNFDVIEWGDCELGHKIKLKFPEKVAVRIYLKIYHR